MIPQGFHILGHAKSVVLFIQCTFSSIPSHCKFENLQPLYSQPITVMNLKHDENEWCIKKSDL